MSSMDCSAHIFSKMYSVLLGVCHVLFNDLAKKYLNVKSGEKVVIIRQNKSSQKTSILFGEKNAKIIRQNNVKSFR